MIQRLVFICAAVWGPAQRPVFNKALNYTKEPQNKIAKPLLIAPFAFLKKSLYKRTHPSQLSLQRVSAYVQRTLKEPKQGCQALFCSLLFLQAAEHSHADKNYPKPGSLPFC